MKILKGLGIALIGFIVAGFLLGYAAIANATPTAIVKYGQEFTYLGSNQWSVKNLSNADAIKNIGNVQNTTLCSNYDTGLGKPCVRDASYTFTGDTSNTAFESCAYVQIDRNGNGSQDTVPGDNGKQVCAAKAVVVTPPPAPTCITAAWTMTSWVDSNTATWPQTLLGSKSAACGDLTWADVPCGSQVQIDSYLDDSTTAALLAGKHLDGPGKPSEHLWTGGKAWKWVKGADCAAVTPPPTETPTPTPTTTPGTTSTPVPNAVVNTPAGPVLAETGTNWNPWALTIPGGLLLAGAVAILVSMKRNRKSLNSHHEERP